MKNLNSYLRVGRLFVVAILLSCSRQPTASAVVKIYDINQINARSLLVDKDLISFNEKKGNLKNYKNLEREIAFNHYVNSSFFEIEVFVSDQTEALNLLNNIIEYLNTKYKLKVIDSPSIYVKGSRKIIRVDAY